MAATKIFISYSHKDDAFVTRLRSDLQATSLDMWIDHESLSPGTGNWDKAIRQGIENSFAVLYIASENAYESDFCQGELTVARLYKRPIYPIFADGTDFARCIPIDLIKVQNVDMRGDRYSAGLPRLLQALGIAQSGAIEPIAPALPDIVTVAPDFKPVNPYKGLDAFTAADRANFFGRTALIAALVDRVEAATAERFLAIVGASGAGKSSVVMAGLLPALQDAHPDWVLLPRIVPGDRPLEALAVMFEQAKHGAVSDYLRDMAEPNARGLVLQTKGLARDPGQRVILFIDQFEELFTQTPREDDRRQFIDLITTAVTDPRSPLHVILTLRADFYDRPLAYAELTRLLNAHTEAIPPMRLTDLREVVEEPARRQHLAFESDLAADLVFAVREQSGALPLLQFTLDQLFARRSGLTLTRAAYDSFGGLRGVVGTRAEETYRALPTDAHRRLARWVFLRLIEPGATEQDTTRRRVSRRDLTPDQPAEIPIVGAVIDEFIAARLLTGGEGDSLEVAHEALLREWPTLVGWIVGARTDLPTQNALRTAAADWLAAGANPDDDGRLARAGRLRDFQEWATRNQPTASERRYIDASAAWESELARRDDQRRQELIAAAARARTARRTAGIVGGVAAAIVVLAAISFIVVQQSAAIARQRSDLAQGAADRSNTQVAIALTSTLAPIPVTIAALQDTLNQSYLGNAQAVMTAQPAYGAYLALHAANGRYQPTVDPVLMTGFSGVFAENVANYPDFVTSVAFSPDGRYILTGSEGTTARLWDVESGQSVRVLRGHLDFVSSVVFSPDGRYALTGSRDGTARLWDLASGQTVRILGDDRDIIAVNGGRSIPSDSVTGVALSPDGRYALTGSDDGTARLWDLANGQALRILPVHTYITSVAFSPDGRYALTGSGDSAARLWNLVTGQIVRVLTGHTSSVTSVAFSPDGRYALTGSGDATARLWDLVSGYTVRILIGSTQGINSVAFSPDGRYALGGISSSCPRVGKAPVNCIRGEGRLWNLAGGQTTLILDSLDTVSSVAFSPDGRYALTGSCARANNTTANCIQRETRLWDITIGKTLRILADQTNIAYTTGVALSPNGQFGVIGSSDNTARLWDVTSGQTVRILSGYTNSVTSMAFSPDGRYVLTGSNDSTARLWDLATGQTVRVLSGHTDWVTSVAFSADGRYALTGSRDGTARLWDLASGQMVRLLSDYFAISSVSFSPDGRYALTGNYGGTARLWNVASGQTVRVLNGPSLVTSVAFSPDGRYALTGNYDGTARLWNVASGQTVRVLNDYMDIISSVAFSPDGLYALTGSSNGTVLWDLANGLTVHILSGHASYVSSVAFSADGRYALTGGGDGTARLWDLASGQEIERYFGALTPLLGAVSLKPGGSPPYSAFTTALCGMLPPLLATQAPDVHDLHTVCPTIPAPTATPTLAAPIGTPFILIAPPTASLVNSPSPTLTPSATDPDSPTLTPSITLTLAFQTSYTPLAIASPTASDTPTATATGTLSTLTLTLSPTYGPTPTVTPTITDTPGPSPTVIFASHFTPEPTASPTLSPTVPIIAGGATAIDSPTASDTPTATVNATFSTFTPTYDPRTTSPTPTASNSPTMTGTLPTATPTVTLNITSGNTALPTLTETPINPSATATLPPDLTPSPSPTATYLGAATATGSPAASDTPIDTPTP